MKTAAIIRVIVGAVAAVLLLLLLVSVLSGRTIFHNGRIDIATESLPGASRAGEEQQSAASGGTQSISSGGKQQTGSGKESGTNAAYSAGSASVPMEQVDQIEIEWVSGLVNLNVGEGNDIIFSESAAKPLTEKQTLRYVVRENKLLITYCESTATLWDWLDVDKLNMPNKDLTLTLPASLMDSLREIQVNAVSAAVFCKDVHARKLEVESVSGDVNITGMMGEKLDVQSVNGDVEILGMDVRELDLETVSGELSASGNAIGVDTEATSGDTSLTLDSAPEKLDMDSVSGKIRVCLPASADSFTAKMDSVSGDLTSDFPGVIKNGRYVVGSGAVEYKFESISGDVELIKR